MKKIMNLNKRAGSKTKLIIFAVVLSFIGVYVDGQTTAPQEQTAEKHEIAQTQQAAQSTDGTDQKQVMPPEKMAHPGTDSQKPMQNSEIAINQGQQAQMKPALPQNPNEAAPISQTKNLTIAKGDAEPKTLSTAPAGASEKVAGPIVDKQNNLVYIGILLALLLAVALFLQSRKAKNNGSGNEKEMQRLIENRKKKD